MSFKTNIMKNTLTLLAVITLAACQKEEMLSPEEILYSNCNTNHYGSEGLVGVYVCAYGTMQEIIVNPELDYRIRKTIMDHLGLRKDPLRDIIEFIVNVEDSLNLVLASNGYSAEIKEELEFFAQSPEHGKFVDWEVNHSFLGRDSGPRSNPVMVTYPMADSERTVTLKPRYKIYPPACPDGCDTEVWLDNLTQPNAYTDDNGYTHIEYNGPAYFTAKMKVSKVDPEYLVNDVPLVQVEWDSDYWMILENIQLAVAYYRPFGLWSQGFAQPIAAVNTTINLNDAVGLYGMTNAVGYSIDKETCLDCPYSKSLYGIRTQVNERTLITQKSIILTNEMVGDTMTLYTKAKFAYDNQYNREETVMDSLQIVIH